MLVLSAPELGGETWFPHADPPALFTPSAGDAAIWLDLDGDGGEERRVYHEGLPVEAGEKTTVTAFFYTPRATFVGGRAALCSETRGVSDRKETPKERVIGLAPD